MYTIKTISRPRKVVQIYKDIKKLKLKNLNLKN